MGTSNLRATQDHQYLEEAVEREQDVIRKCQSSDAEKGVYLDQLDIAKNEVAEMNSLLEKMKEQQNKVECSLRGVQHTSSEARDEWLPFLQNRHTLSDSEVAAGWAVLNSGLSRGDKDVVSNIVDGAVNLLKTQKEFDVLKKPVYDGLRSLVEYFVPEMTNVILETRPELTIAAAMRCLPKSNMNLVRACVSNGGSGFRHQSSDRPPLCPPNFTSPYPAGKKSPINLKEMRDQLCHARDQIWVSAQAAGDTIDNRGIGKKAKPKKDNSRLKAILFGERTQGSSEVATKCAVLNSGLCRGDKDVVSNIVDGAVNLLKTQKEFDVPKKPVYDGLRSLVEYFVLEMTNVILETRPELTMADVMQCC
ncbi:hypothetical protein F511_26409 [Dorcoceras hygrometricum]|uniref:PIR2-like helical domain-containing protein n=1 Tax=Dorcoceras hygrometricum TaxID=472368 RepID=A0A2Z7CAT0_9LAMI|nr:hypothetical protein F511_26409 [Dorcoceras hygrometricum]